MSYFVPSSLLLEVSPRNSNYAFVAPLCFDGNCAEKISTSTLKSVNHSNAHFNVGFKESSSLQENARNVQKENWVLCTTLNNFKLFNLSIREKLKWCEAVQLTDM